MLALFSGFARPIQGFQLRTLLCRNVLYIRLRNMTYIQYVLRTLDSAFLLSLGCSFITIKGFYSAVLSVALVEVGIPEYRPGNAGLLHLICNISPPWK